MVTAIAFHCAPTFVLPPPAPVGGVKQVVVLDDTGGMETDPPPFAAAVVEPGAIQTVMLPLGLQI